MLISSKKMSSPVFNQMSGYPGLAKLTTKTNYDMDGLELLRQKVGKESFIKVLVEMRVPVTTNILDLFSCLSCHLYRTLCKELAANVGKSFVGRRAA